MQDPSARLKKLYQKGAFDASFIEACKEDLPFLFGRMSLLEEFYSHNAPGFSERSRNLAQQLAQPLHIRRGLRSKLKALLGGI